MADKITDQCLENNKAYASGKALHNPVHRESSRSIPQGMWRSSHAWMRASMSRICSGCRRAMHTSSRNAGGVVTEDVIRCSVISHHLLDTSEIILIHRAAACSPLPTTSSRPASKVTRRPETVATGDLAPRQEHQQVRLEPVPVSPSAVHLSRSMHRAAKGRRSAWVGRAAGHVVHPQSPLDPEQRADAVTVRSHLRRGQRCARGGQLPGPMGSIA